MTAELRLSVSIKTVAELDQLAKKVVKKYCGKPCIVFVQGPLGAGKTQLIKQLLYHMGCQDRVVSPTYPIIQTYHWTTYVAHHMDCYRLHHDIDTTKHMIMDYYEENRHYLFAEWPEYSLSQLVDPKIKIKMTWQEDEMTRLVKVYEYTSK